MNFAITLSLFEAALKGRKPPAHLDQRHQRVRVCLLLPLLNTSLTAHDPARRLCRRADARRPPLPRTGEAGYSVEFEPLRKRVSEVEVGQAVAERAAWEGVSGVERP